MIVVDSHPHVYSADEQRYHPIEKPLRPPEDTGTSAHLRHEMEAAGVGGAEADAEGGVAGAGDPGGGEPPAAGLGGVEELLVSFLEEAFPERGAAAEEAWASEEQLELLRQHYPGVRVVLFEQNPERLRAPKNSALEDGVLGWRWGAFRFEDGSIA